MKKDRMIYNRIMAINRTNLRFLLLVSLAMAFFGCLASLFRKLQDNVELGKYDNSIHIAVDFYKKYTWKTDASEIVLTDAWSRPFEIKANPAGRHLIFMSTGSDPRRTEDDLHIEISNLAYRHEFTFKSHFNSSCVHYD